MPAGHYGLPFVVLLPAQIVLGSIRKLDKHRPVSEPAYSALLSFLLLVPGLSSLNDEIEPVH